MELPEDNPDIISLYLHFLYTGELAVLPWPEPEGYKGHEERLNLSHLFVLAEKLQDTAAKNEIVKAMAESSGILREDECYWYPNLGAIEIIYSGTTESSPIRKLMVDMYVHNLRSSWKSHGAPAEFPEDVTVELLKHRETCRPDTTRGRYNVEAYLEENKGYNL